MKYPDTIKLAETTVDGYGDRTVTGTTDIRASFVQRSGFQRVENIEGETSDAAVYLYPKDTTVLSKLDDLEGMYLQVEPYSDNNWYQIIGANVARRKLLNNAIDNVYCQLQKVAGLAYVHNS